MTCGCWIFDSYKFYFHAFQSNYITLRAKEREKKTRRKIRFLLFISLVCFVLYRGRRWHPHCIWDVHWIFHDCRRRRRGWWLHHNMYFALKAFFFLSPTLACIYGVQLAAQCTPLVPFVIFYSFFWCINLIQMLRSSSRTKDSMLLVNYFMLRIKRKIFINYEFWFPPQTCWRHRSTCTTHAHRISHVNGNAILMHMFILENVNSWLADTNHPYPFFFI